MNHRDYLLKVMKKQGIEKDEFHRRVGISAGYARNLFMDNGPVPGEKLAEKIVKGLKMSVREKEEFFSLIDGQERRGRVAGFKALLKFVEKNVPEPQFPYDEVAELYPVGAISEKKPVFNWENFYHDAEQKEAKLIISDMKVNIVFERDDLGGMNKLLCPVELEENLRYRWQVEQIIVLDSRKEKRVRSPEMSFLVLDEKGAQEAYDLERDMRANLVLQAIKKKLYRNALRELSEMEEILPDDEEVKKVKRALREFIFTNPY